MLEKIQLVKQKIRKAIFFIFYASSFKKFGQNSTLCYPFKIEGAKFISIASKIYINESAWLLALQKDKTPPKIKIGRGTYIYKLKVKDMNGEFIEKLEKLVILK